MFGSLTESSGVVRFFSPPEVASLHGSVRPVLCQRNRRLAMRLLGNAISIPHAAVSLLQCCHTAGLALQITAESVVQSCLEHRLNNGNAVFIPQGQDWLFCPLQEAQRFLCIAPEPALAVPRVADMFRKLTLQTADGEYSLFVTHQVSLRGLLQGFGLSAAAASVPLALDTGCTPLAIPAAFRPALVLSGLPQIHCDARSLVAVCTRHDAFILHATSPLRVLQLAAVACEQAVYWHQPLHLCKPSGLQVGLEAALPPLAFLT